MNLTAEMTYSSLCWMRYEKQCDLVCTEIGNNHLKDVFGIFIAEDGLPASSIEIEVKSSMSDFKRDFESKAKKHEWYAEGRQCPNYMYYVVPKSITEAAKEFLRTKSTKYGLMEFDSEKWLEGSRHPYHAGKCLTSVLRVSKLTEARPKPSLMYQAGRRIMNEYFLQRHEIRNWSARSEHDVEYYAKAIVRRERGKIDKYNPIDWKELND